MKSKLITEKDVNDLLKFACRNMNNYVLLYAKHKILFALLILFALFVVILGIISVCFVLQKSKFSDILLIVTLGSSFVTAMIFNRLCKLKVLNTPHIQNLRLKKLRRYYKTKGYSKFEMKCLIRLLRQKEYKGSSLNFSVILGFLLLPIWENYVSYLYEKILDGLDFSKILIGLFLRIFIIAIAIWCTFLINLTFNYIFTFRRRRIDNIIYITRYIIYDLRVKSFQ